VNVLLTCVGRRLPTVRAFKAALGTDDRVVACDADPFAPGLEAADAGFLVPGVDDPGYCDALLELCRAERIGLLIPTFEVELPLLAIGRERFVAIGTLPLVSSLAVINTCFDKLATARFLVDRGVAVPRTFAALDEAIDAVVRQELTFPVVVKPRWGVSSIETEFPEDVAELRMTYALARMRLARTFLAEISASDPEHSVLIQEHLGGDEFGLDIINDLNGRYVCTFARRKLRMRAGQTDRAVTVHDAKLDRLGEVIGTALGHVGILDCDVFVDDRGVHVIDLNPRFGAGYPFSHRAGANLPAALVAWAEGREPDADWLTVEPDVVAARADDLVVITRTAIRAGADASLP
jgi:carbamoyl-phosphate synthase large subunit